MGWGPFEFVRRAITLPKAYNSLADIARNPLGAAANVMPYVAIASGMGWLKVPGFPTGWLKAGKWSLGDLTQWVQKNPAQAALLAAGAYNAYRAGQQHDRAESGLARLQGIYEQLLTQSLPLATALSRARINALADIFNQPETAIAQARRALDSQLEHANRLQAFSGLRSLSADRLRSRALSDFAGQVAALRNASSWQRLSMLLGAGTGYDANALGALTVLAQQRLARATSADSQALTALASLLPYILDET